MVYEFKFPDVGEGITEGEVVKWLVKEGQKINENDNIVQIETDKAVVDIPSPKTGKILKLHFKEGDTIKVGDVIITIDDGSVVKETVKKTEPKDKPKICKIGEPCDEDEAVSKKKSVSVVGELEEASEEVQEKSRVSIPGQHGDNEGQKTKVMDNVLAVPRVRDLAKKLGVDITKLKGSGSGGRVTDDDVIAASGSRAPDSAKSEGSETKVKILKKYDMWGYVDRVPLKGVRKAVAKNVMQSSHNIASVSAMIDIDVTKLWRLREKEKINAENKGIKLTFFPYIIRAVIEGLKKHPYLNSEMHEDEIILKKYYNIGIAVDTEAGLMVPVIKRAEFKSLYDIAKEIVGLADKARKRELDLMDFKGGSFTITNYGSIGTNYGTPIINPPEAAILGLGKIFDRVMLLEGNTENRKILPVSLTFDHRILDGAEAARFLNVVKEHLEEPDKIRFDGDKQHG